MEPWGIIMTGVTLFGMLGLLIAGVRMDDGFGEAESTELPEVPATQSAETEIRKAA